ncbi:hypothetical protein O1C94_000402 [Vibrio cholerae]|nr:hypothetical protein [Vibrio cholerae]
MSKYATKKSLIQLEEKYINQDGVKIPELILSGHIKKLEKTHPDLIDEGDLICHVVVGPNGFCEVAKVCSRLDLFSVTDCSKGENFAQTAMNTTSLWFDNTSVVVATGEAVMLEESDKFGVYKLKVQIQKWR